MPDTIEEWFSDKKKTYWKAWATPEGYAWALFFKEDICEPGHHGVENTEEMCYNQIRWVIGTYLKRQSLL